MSVTIVGVSSDTPVINYTPNTIDEYIVVVNLPEDWETVHNYIINETVSNKVFKIHFDDYSSGVVIFRYAELTSE